MKRFMHINATTVDDAVSILGEYGGRASVIAGGTDLMGVMKDRILPEYPEALVNIKTIPGLDYISEEDGILRIGALACLTDIASHPIVKGRYSALAQAAHRVAFPEIRNMGTIGGNICQGVRCWYYRASNNFFNCLRKGGKTCYAVAGDNRHHSVFGHVQACFAVNPSDVAPALVALDASVVTSKRTVAAEGFFTASGAKTTVLDNAEIVIEIQLPAPSTDTRSTFTKFAIRKSGDFPIVNCAAALAIEGRTVKKARICLNAVYNTPYRVTAAEEAIAGKSIDEPNAGAAGSAAVSDARPMTKNKYKIEIAKTLVKRAVLACG